MTSKVLKTLGVLSLILFFTQNNYAQTAEWAPVINTSKTGGTNSDGVFNNLTDNSWYTAANLEILLLVLYQHQVSPTQTLQ